MPRPVKWRRVEYIPENRSFVPRPMEKCACFEGIQEVQLKIEELEAMRLKDIEELNQEECALRMQISRQTFQNILDGARKKVVTALIENKAIKISGGHYTKNICNLKCITCGNETKITYEENNLVCHHCGSNRVVCNEKHCITQCDKLE